MIELSGITKSFGTLQVLKGIDLLIGKGEIVSIVGPSGAGKTTAAVSLEARSPAAAEVTLRQEPKLMSNAEKLKKRSNRIFITDGKNVKQRYSILS